MADVDNNQQNGFISGVTNLFDGFTGASTKVLDLYNNWSFAEDARSQREAQLDVDRLRSNWALTSENNKYLMSENQTRIISYIVLGGVSIAAIYAVTKLLK